MASVLGVLPVKITMLGSRVGTFERRIPVLERRNPVYDTADHRTWASIVTARAHGFCQDPLCKTPHRKPSRLYADHVKELGDMTPAEIAAGLPFNPANGLARCGSCHSRKTAEERAKRHGLR